MPDLPDTPATMPSPWSPVVSVTGGKWRGTLFRAVPSCGLVDGRRQMTSSRLGRSSLVAWSRTLVTLAMALRMALDRLTAATIRYSRCSAFALCSIIAGISFSVQATSARTSRRACFYCFEKLRRLAKRDKLCCCLHKRETAQYVDKRRLLHCRHARRRSAEPLQYR